ncbi:DUF4926 domain-containing protein [Mucilaginibacter sp. L3T2-6]|uniref:DUF4926 domain-containing protein n=1 Tax=Mucilaginibacter sp. L3T2-6 TaxID=3062491 RepID=UPI0034A0BDE7
MSVFRLYDIVQAKGDLSEKVLKGCTGTILIVYDKQSPDYEVEFVNDSSETVDILTVKNQDVILKSVV